MYLREEPVSSRKGAHRRRLPGELTAQRRAVSLTATIDQLILSQRRAIQWHLFWFIGIVLLGVALLAVNLTMGWIKEVGPNLGTAFVLFLAKPPLSGWLKRRDRIGALKMLKISISQVEPGSPEAKRMKDIVWKTIEKMAGG